MPNFFERYQSGEHEIVWDEMLTLGSAIRAEPYYADAVAVAQETMKRVRSNCEVIIPRLEQLGWKFGYGWSKKWAREQVQKQPPPLGIPVSSAYLDTIENNLGLLPISLRAFYEIVGAINFVGTPFKRPNWPDITDGLDPLYIASIDLTLGDDQPISLKKDKYPEIFIAPDYLMKYFYSGVGDFTIKIPCSNADSPLIFQDESTQVHDQDLTLVRYLRYAMKDGGFLAFLEGEQEQKPESDLNYLTANLLLI